MENTGDWELMSSIFPFGDTLNENTHIFDYILYEGKNGGKKVISAALPIAFSDRAANIGRSVVGTIHRLGSLDFVENLLIQKYADLSLNGDSFMVMLPQDDGIRLIITSVGLPFDVFFISNNPSFRTKELDLFWDNRDPDISYKSLKVVLYRVTNGNDEDFNWIEDVCKERRVCFSRKDFCLPRIVNTQYERMCI